MLGFIGIGNICDLPCPAVHNTAQVGARVRFLSMHQAVVDPCTKPTETKAREIGVVDIGRYSSMGKVLEHLWKQQVDEQIP